MIYKLEKATSNHLELLIQYKLKSIVEYAKDISQEELSKINDYVNTHIEEQLKDYKIIKSNNRIIGCILVEPHLDGVIIDEIFIEEEYRNQKIGTEIIKDVLSNNDRTYLWVYKNNVKAYGLCKKLGFEVIEETKSRYFMKYSKIKQARNFCKEVKILAQKYNLPFFIVTDGASATKNNGCDAVQNARESHKKWELEHGFDPEEDWNINNEVV